MSGPVTTLLPRASRSILIAAAVLALLGSIAVPAQAGDFGNPYGYGYSRYSYGPRYGYNGCSSCGCHRCGCYRCGCGGCGSTGWRGGVYERRYRYVEREYIERRYVAPIRRYPYYGYGCCGPSHSYYQGYRSPFPYGYGGIRGEGSHYGYGPAAYQYEEPPRPPAPVGYDGGGYGDEGGRWE
jgi:hypothetical protein